MDDEHQASPMAAPHEPSTAARIGDGAGAELPGPGGGEGVVERDEVAGAVGRMDGSHLTPKDAGGQGPGGGGGRTQ
jgi:hypothetical protein